MKQEGVSIVGGFEGISLGVIRDKDSVLGSGDGLWVWNVI